MFSILGFSFYFDCTERFGMEEDIVVKLGCKKRSVPNTIPCAILKWWSKEPSFCLISSLKFLDSILVPWSSGRTVYSNLFLYIVYIRIQILILYQNFIFILYIYFHIQYNIYFILYIKNNVQISIIFFNYN